MQYKLKNIPMLVMVLQFGCFSGEFSFTTNGFTVSISESPFTWSLSTEKGEIIVEKRETLVLGKNKLTTYLKDSHCNRKGFRAKVFTAESKHIGSFEIVAFKGGVEISFEFEDSTKIRELLSDHQFVYYGVWEHSYTLPSNIPLEFAGRRPIKPTYLINNGLSEPYYSIRVDGYCSFANARAPWFFTNKNWGVYVKSDDVSDFRFAVNDLTSFSMAGKKITYDVLFGTNAAELLSLFNQKSSRAHIPPEWAYGPFFWRDDAHQDLRGMNGAGERILLDVKRLTDLRIPCSGIWIDRPYGTGVRGWGNLDFEPTFGDPKELIANLDKQGYRTMLWISNRCNGKLYEEGSKLGLLLGDKGSGANLSHQSARRWMRESLDVLVKTGVHGFKIDRGEEGEIPDALQNELCVRFAEVAKEALQSKRGNDHFLIARNMHDRGRAYCGIFNGDPQSSFEGLQESIRNGLRANLILFPMWGSDTGGYTGSPSKELMARWLEFSAFCPMMEVLIGPSRTIWDDYDQELIDLCRKYCEVHERLVPYLHAAMQQCVDTGMPPMRPLFLTFPNAPACESVWDTYMLGDALLVAPVIQSGQSRTVVLPPGTWLDYWDRTSLYQGESELTMNVPLNRIPVFIRAGQILAEGRIVRNNLVKDPSEETLQLHWFPEKSAGEVSSRIPLESGEVSIRASLDEAGVARIKVFPGKSKVVVVVHAKNATDLKVAGDKNLTGSGGDTTFEVLVRNQTEFSIENVKSLFDAP